MALVSAIFTLFCQEIEPAETMANGIIRVFTIMPFAPEFDPVYSGIAKAAKEASTSQKHIVVQRLDEVSAAGQISDDLVRSLAKSDFCVADLTGNNPNVMWEVGYAMGIGKKVIALSQDIGTLPFDLKDLRTIRYDLSNSGPSLVYPLLKAIRATVDVAADAVEFSQVNIGSRTLGILISDVDSAETLVSRLPQDGSKPNRNRVKELAEAAGLFERSIANPQLRFLDGDVSFWFEQGLPETDLRIEFCARKAVILAADRSDIDLGDQGALSTASQSVSKKLYRAKTN